MTTQSSIAFSVGVPQSSRAIIDFDQNLQMVNCSECAGSEWCAHRGLVIQEAAEASMLHDWFSLMEDTEVIIPILPSKSVHLGVLLKHAGPNISVFDANTEDLLGVVDQWQGLGAMRTLFMDHVQAQIDQGEPFHCTGSHGIQAKRAEEKAAAGTRSAWLAYAIIIKLRGMCEICARRENYDDLVPDVPVRAGRPNPWK